MRRIHLLLSVVLAGLLICAPAWAAAKRGGSINVGQGILPNLDPHFATGPSDLMVASQLYQRLVDINQDHQAVPDLAESWTSADGLTWTFKIRAGQKFSDGRPLTAKDVVFSFDRLRDPQVGTPVVGLYSAIKEVKALDDLTVQFTLSEPNPEFPVDTGEYHGAIIPAGSKDPGTERITSGAFMIKEYYPEDRIILVRNPHFNRLDSDGQPLPYLDEIVFLFSSDMIGQTEALKTNDLDFIGGLAQELLEGLKDFQKTTRVITQAENFHWSIHMRSDVDRPAADPRVRQALKLGTDHEELIRAVRPGLAVVGNGTPVGPSYKDYYLDKKPVHDPEKARALLAEAGYKDGLNLEVVSMNWDEVTKISTVWAQQMAKIGVKVQIRQMPQDVYYADGDDSWLKCDFGVTDWSTRGTPVTYFKLAYTLDATWNSAHWSDKEFDQLVRQVDTEMDLAKRVALYHQLQEIFIERGPSIITFMQESGAGLNKNLEGVQLAYTWTITRFWNAWLNK